MYRKTGVLELIDEWRAEGRKEAEAFGEGWRQENIGQHVELTVRPAHKEHGQVSIVLECSGSSPGVDHQW